jgi:RNA-directed DNA polymerase
MSTDNRRKEGAKDTPEAKTEFSGRNPTKYTNSAMVDKAERETSILPDGQRYIHIPKIEGVVNDLNMQEAIKMVMRNKGAPGIDGITTEQIKEEMHEHWPKIKQQILEGKYYPKAVKKVEIPKPDGYGVRQLGIPTVMDRVIQQAVYQELVYVFEPVFSEHSYGFRKGRKAQQAVLKAQQYIQNGCNWVVDIDLEKFFDRVNHDMLMSRIARRVKDKKILLLIRRFLQSGVMDNGLIKTTEEGTPQGGPLSPLLSNIMLDDLDKELEKRKLRFVRYADDCNIYLKSEKAGQRVMESVVKFLTTKLKLKVNQNKSAVAHPWDRKFLGFTFSEGGESCRIKIHESRVKRFKTKIKGLTKKMRASRVTDCIQKLVMPIVRGWANYFSIAEEQGIFKRLDGWVRRKIRAILWRQWKKPKTRCEQLMKRGLKRESARDWANSSKGPWRMAHTYCMHKAVSNKILESMGYTPMMEIVNARS